MRNLTLDMDTLLGGESPSDEKSSSQKAVKTYVDNNVKKNITEMDDVSLDSVSNGQVLSYDSSTHEWTNTTPTKITLSKWQDVSTITISVDNWDSLADTIHYLEDGEYKITHNTIFNVNKYSTVRFAVEKQGYFPWVSEEFEASDDSYYFEPELQEGHEIDDSVLEDYEYNTDDNYVYLTSYIGGETDVTLPNV